MADFTIKIESDGGNKSPVGSSGAGGTPPQQAGGGSGAPPIAAVNTGGLGTAAANAGQASVFSRLFRTLKIGVIAASVSAAAVKMVRVTAGLDKVVTKLAAVAGSLGARGVQGARENFPKVVDWLKGLFGNKTPAREPTTMEKIQALLARFGRAARSDWGRAATGVGVDALALTGGFGQTVLGLASRFGGLALKAGKAAMSNPYTAAIAAGAVAVSAFVVATGAAVGVLTKMFNAANAITKELANYSPQIRGIVRRMEVAELLRQRRRATVLAPSLESTAASRNRFNQQYFEFKLMIEKQFYEVTAALSPLMDIAGIAIRGVRMLASVEMFTKKLAFDSVIKFFDAFFPYASTVINILAKINKWLPRLEGSDPDVSALINMGYGDFTKNPSARPIF